MTMIDPDRYTDGNELAGPLSEIFVDDLTAATAWCDHCGRGGPMATLRVYSRVPGWVARCPGCHQVMVRLVRGPAHAWLDLRGTRTLRIAMPIT
jgi:hypothetical protein